MNCARTAPTRSVFSSIFSGAAAIVSILASVLWAQSTAPAATAKVSGVVLDSHNHRQSGATVSLQAKGGPEAETTHTDAQGAYLFSVRPGAYRLHAEMAGVGEVTVDSLLLGSGDSKRIDLALKPANASSAQISSYSAAEFFDEPEFTVAGVTDPTNLGGHGSDTVVRSRESLARETASLSKIAPGSEAVRSQAADEEALRAAVARGSGSFDANHRLGKLLAEEGKAAEAIPYLERASQLSPKDFDNTYELALAYADVNKYDEARRSVETLLARQDKAELHHLLGDVEEKQNRPLEAVREYQRAAEMTPTEPYVFDWGAELLTHRAIEPATEIFMRGSRLFPQSVRMRVGLGVAYYARGAYDDAAQSLCAASDLNPADETPYLFMGRMQSALAAQPPGIAERLARFAELQPENALANYYYAVSLWKQRTADDSGRFAQIESLLQKAVHLDPKLGAGYLQLGILYSERREWAKAIAAYQAAIKVDPQMEEPHYRLAQAYRQSGEKEKSAQEVATYERLSKESESQFEQQRREIQQFVYTLRGPASRSER